MPSKNGNSKAHNYFLGVIRFAYTKFSVIDENEKIVFQTALKKFEPR